MVGYKNLEKNNQDLIATFSNSVYPHGAVTDLENVSWEMLMIEEAALVAHPGPARNNYSESRLLECLF